MRTGTKTTRAARDVAVVGPRDDAARTLNRTYLSSKAARAGAGEEEAWTRCVVDRVEARSRSLVQRVIDGSDRVFPIFAETESDERALVRIVHVLRRKRKGSGGLASRDWTLAPQILTCSISVDADGLRAKLSKKLPVLASALMTDSDVDTYDESNVPVFQALREAIDPRQSPALYLSSSAVDRLCFDGSWRLTYTPGMACLRRAAFTFGGALLASHVYRAEREIVLKRKARKDEEVWILTHTLISRETRVLDHVLTLRVMLACSVREERALRMNKRDTVDDFVNRLRSQNAGSQAIARMIDGALPGSIRDRSPGFWMLAYENFVLDEDYERAATARDVLNELNVFVDEEGAFD